MQFLEDLSSKLRASLAESPVADLEKNIQALLQSAFAKLSLVSREEFDVQAEVLRKTQEKLDALEKQLNALEQAQLQLRQGLLHLRHPERRRAHTLTWSVISGCSASIIVTPAAAKSARCPNAVFDTCGATNEHVEVFRRLDRCQAQQ